MTNSRSSKYFLWMALAAFFVFSMSHRAYAVMNSDGTMIKVPMFTEAVKLIEKERFQESIVYLNDTLRQHPGHASAWNLMGYVHRRLGQFDLAEQYYSAALTISPYHIGALNYMGQLFVQTGRPELAKELLIKLETACPDGCEAREQLSNAIETGIAGNY